MEKTKDIQADESRNLRAVFSDEQKDRQRKRNEQNQYAASGGEKVLYAEAEGKEKYQAVRYGQSIYSRIGHTRSPEQHMAFAHARPGHSAGIRRSVSRHEPQRRCGGLL